MTIRDAQWTLETALRARNFLDARAAKLRDELARAERQAAEAADVYDEARAKYDLAVRESLR